MTSKNILGSETQVIDAKGMFLMPGLIEGHGHIHGLGASLINLNLMKAKNWDEIVAMVGEAAKKAKPGDWIIRKGMVPREMGSCTCKELPGLSILPGTG